MAAQWVKPAFSIFPLPLQVFLYSLPILLLCLICITKWLYLMTVYVCVNLEYLCLYSREENINYNLLNIFLLHGLSRSDLATAVQHLFLNLFSQQMQVVIFLQSNVRFLGTCFGKNGTYRVYLSVWKEWVRIMVSLCGFPGFKKKYFTPEGKNISLLSSFKKRLFR